MKSSRYQQIIPAALFLLFSPYCAQAARLTHIGYIYPAGGQQGVTFEAEIGGQYLDGVYAVEVTGGGVEAKILEHIVPETLKTIKEAQEKIERDKLKTDKAPVMGEPEPMVPTTLRKKIRNFKQQPSAQIEEIVMVRFTITSGAQVGKREVRVLTKAGASNPIVFYVGSLPEYREKEPNDREPNPAVLPEFPSVINGQILPGDVDRFRVIAQKGQSLVFETKARALVPYLADTVPGWFQVVITLFDAKGKEAGYADDYQFNPDPVLFYDVPEDGEYLLEIRDALYRGREDFTYRITVGELPFITSHFPLGGSAGEKVFVKVSGKNLPVSGVEVSAGNNASGAYFDLKNKKGLLSNRIRFDVDTLPEVIESEPNNNNKQAQPVTLPVIINGRIQPFGDHDIFSFTAKAGQEISAEVIARRLDSPLDSLLRLTDASGRVLAGNDDNEDKGLGLNTHQADSRLSFKLPQDGVYYAQLLDAQNHGGEEYAYRLRIGPRNPDFALRVTPSSMSVPAGCALPISVYALRKDGFGGDIKVVLKDVPAGWVLSGGLISAGRDRTRMTLSAPKEAVVGPVALQMEGRALIDSNTVIRPVVPAEDMMQAFAYRHLVPAETFLGLVLEDKKRMPVFELVETGPINIPAGGAAQVRLRVPPRMQFMTITLELSEPPKGVSLGSVNIAAGILTFTVQVDGKEVPPAFADNLIIEAFTELPVGPPDDKGVKAKRRVSLGVLPAVSVNMLPY